MPERRTSSRIASQAKRPADSGEPEAAKKPRADGSAAAPPQAGDNFSNAGPLSQGSVLPTLKLTSDSGESVTVPADLSKAVIFTYPKASTPGCTTQGQCYRDSYSQFETAGWKVYGLSADSPSALAKWKEKQSFPYPLLSDPERELIGALTGEKGKTIRSHFVVDAQGTLALRSIGVKPKESAEATLEFIKTTGEPEEAQDGQPAQEEKKDQPAETKADKEDVTGTGPLKTGQQLPSFTLRTDEETEVTIPSGLRKAVVFTYPKASTPGCTTQGLCYRDANEAFTSAGWKVFGLSADLPDALKSWKAEQQFKYPLLSDPERALIGVLTGEKSKTLRSHFVVDDEGKLALSSIGVDPKESAESTLAFIQADSQRANL